MVLIKIDPQVDQCYLLSMKMTYGEIEGSRLGTAVAALKQNQSPVMIEIQA